MPVTVQLAPYTPALSAAWQQGRLGEALGGVHLPEGWPTFPQGLEPEHAREVPREGVGFGPYLFLRGDGATLVGNGGFYGAPNDGVVELGYEIAPAHRGQGLAQAAVRALLALAWRDPTVRQVQAHTLSHDNPSTGVLRRCGFAHEATLPDDEQGSIWRWTLNR